VQNFVLVDSSGGAASRITNVVVSEAVHPGHRCAGWAGGTLTCESGGTTYTKYIASTCD